MDETHFAWSSDGEKAHTKDDDSFHSFNKQAATVAPFFIAPHSLKDKLDELRKIKT